MSSGEPELILSQEQGANMRLRGVAKELEAEFGEGVKQGTLILTNRRLIFVCTNDRGEELPVGFFGEHLLLYSEVEDLESIPAGPPNVFIELGSIQAAGHKGELGRPSLEVQWEDRSGKHAVVFTETLTGKRHRNLDDWASVIDEIKKGTLKLLNLPEAPSTESLDGKILHIMADMQEKGLFEIEESVEAEYDLSLDPDDVEAAAGRLSDQGLLIRISDSSGGTFYRRASPLGGEDASS